MCGLAMRDWGAFIDLSLFKPSGPAQGIQLLSKSSFCEDVKTQQQNFSSDFGRSLWGMSWQTFKLQHSTHSDQHREGQKTLPENLLGLNKVQLLHTGHQGSLQSAGKINKKSLDLPVQIHPRRPKIFLDSHDKCQ